MSGKIYTRTGDSGETSLANGDRVVKNSVRVNAYGTIDEANSNVGLIRAELEMAVAEEAALDRMLDFAQHRLFNCSSRLATPAGSETEHTAHVSDSDVARLEGYIDELSARTSELEHFVLPGGCELSSRMHVARTVVRRAERAILDLDAAEEVEPSVLKFVNRLSDLLFAMARFANSVYQGGDVHWDPEYAE